MPRIILSSFCLMLLLAWAGALCAEPQPLSQGKTIELAAPDKTGGMPLMQALAQRHSNRDMSGQAISPQDLSNLLWATWGINRDNGRHTAPTANNKQQVSVLVAMESGLWVYDSAKHQLVQVMEEDIRPRLDGAPPQALIYAAPGNEMSSAMHVGSLYQNAGLYCASSGLANVVRITGANALAGIIPLPQGYEVYIVQAVGLPR